MGVHALELSVLHRSLLSQLACNRVIRPLDKVELDISYVGVGIHMNTVCLYLKLDLVFKLLCMHFV